MIGKLGSFAKTSFGVALGSVGIFFGAGESLLRGDGTGDGNGVLFFGPDCAKLSGGTAVALANGTAGAVSNGGGGDAGGLGNGGDVTGAGGGDLSLAQVAVVAGEAIRILASEEAAAVADASASPELTLPDCCFQSGRR